jgi:hypothetical protein
MNAMAHEAAAKDLRGTITDCAGFGLSEEVRLMRGESPGWGMVRVIVWNILVIESKPIYQFPS